MSAGEVTVDWRLSGMRQATVGTDCNAEARKRNACVRRIASFRGFILIVNHGIIYSRGLQFPIINLFSRIISVPVKYYVMSIELFSCRGMLAIRARKHDRIFTKKTLTVRGC